MRGTPGSCTTACLAAALLVSLSALPCAAQGEPLVQAIEALNRQDFAAAAPLLAQALEADPDNVEIRFNLAYAYTEMADDERAAEAYRAVLERKPDLAQARANLAMVLLRQDRALDAVPHLTKLVELRPDDYQARYLEAHALAASGNHSAAVSSYTRALEIDASAATAHLELGQSLAELERFEQAASSYERAVELDPELGSYRFDLAEKVERSGDTAKAIELYRAYLDARPQEVAVRERLGFLLLESDRYKEAIVELEQAVSLAPSTANRAALAQAYSLGDNAEKALAKWAEAVESEPDVAALRLRYAAALLGALKYELAGEQYFAAAKLDPNHAEIWKGLAFTLYQGENYAGTLKALDNVAKLEELNPANLYLRAITQDRLRLWEEAQASYQQFLAGSAGMEDEEFKARQRLRAIERVLSKK